MTSPLLLAAACFLAYSNGANDNFKGVATLFGSDTTDYRGAILWGTATTFLGSVASVFLAQRLLAAFSGKGLVPDVVAGTEPFLLAVAAGAGVTVFLATAVGLPISTTHALVGAIAGSGIAAAGSGVDGGVLATTFGAPLVASPVLALVSAALLYAGLRRLRIGLSIEKETCVCVGERPTEAGRVATGVAAGRGLVFTSGTAARLPTLSVGHEAECTREYVGRVFGLGAQRLMDSAHYLSAGAVSFARGLNDTPKIAALLLTLQVTDVPWGLVVVGTAIAVGGLLNARRVGITMGRRITAMNHGQGFAANLTTAFLVIGASRLGLPVSTTHVSVGSLFGIGLLTGQANPPVLRDVVVSWVATLPCAALAGGVVYWGATTLVL